MSHNPSVAARLDAAVDHLLEGATPAVAAASAGLPVAQRHLVETAAWTGAALPVPSVAPRFEARLGARLSGAAPRDAVGWALRHPGRLIVTGAVGSAVGVGVTAYAVWRTSRRVPAHRLLHR